MTAFTRFIAIDCPAELPCDTVGSYPAFSIRISADGPVPFPQVVLRAGGQERLVNGPAIRPAEGTATAWTYVAAVPAGTLPGEHVQVQIEGCRRADIGHAGGEDWIKEFRDIRLIAPARPAPAPIPAAAAPQQAPAPASTQASASAAPAARSGVAVPGAGVAVSGGGVRLYFGIHKHMHQPYYDTTDRHYWDGEKDQIFGSCGGNYTDFIPAAVRQYIGGGLPHAGLSTSWSGSLIEQLDRCADEGLCGGRFTGWNGALRALAGEHTALGHPRVAFSAFGFFHPLMPLIPHRDIVRQIAWHRSIVKRAFGAEASRVLFPPETAFHVRMIPALIEAGVTAVIYDSIHRARACRDYPYAGPAEGMLPPNPAEQVNPPVDDWLQLHNIWAGSKISPRLLRPEYVGYEDPDGQVHKIVAVPAERYIGNEDARGGFGALQYPDVLGQVYQRIVETGSFDPAHPPFFLLHSDGDNHGGGADSYYHDNTARLVEWLRTDPRFELTTVEDYLERFPPDPARVCHIEPGSWAGADNGDPQFMKWFSRYDQPYSPDLNSWAVLTAFQNHVHTLEASDPEHPQLAEAVRLLLTAETSCYWYWTGQEVWDRQVTNAANRGLELIQPAVEALVRAGADHGAPTIFPPWVTPENPGGQRWGQGGLREAPREGVVHTFVADCAGLKRVDLILRTPSGEHRLPMRGQGPYRSATGARVSADYYTALLPTGVGDIRYYIEAEDRCGNIAHGALERIWMA